MDGTIEVPSGTNVVLVGGSSLTRGTNTESAFFKVPAGASLTLAGEEEAAALTLDGGYDSVTATEPLIINQGTLHITENVVLQNNSNSTSTGTVGGAILTSGTLNISGGTIKNTHGAGDKGSVAVDGGTFSMTGGVITGSKNRAVNVLLGEFILDGGSITNNSTGSSGAALFLTSGSSKFTMKSGIISKNTAGTHAGAINLGGAGTSMVMTGGTISENTAKGGNGGGAIYMSGSSQITMMGGTVSGNIANAGNGAGVYCNGVQLEIGGSANLADAIYLNQVKVPITVTSEMENPVGPLELNLKSMEDTVIVKNAAGMNTETLKSLFTFESSEYELEADDSMNLVLKNATSYMLMNIGETGTFGINGADNVTYTSNNENVATVDENGVVQAVATGNALITAEADGVKRTCGVTVVESKVSSINIANMTMKSYKKSLELKSTRNVMQGFAMKSDGTLYIIQKNADGENTEIDCILNKVASDGTMSYMYLNQFGHGNTIAVEETDEGDYIWVPSMGNSEGTSNGLSRIKWDAEQTYTEQTGTTWTEGIFYYNPDVSIDMSSKRLMVSVEGIKSSGGGRICYIYDLDGFVSGEFTEPLYRVDIPFSSEEGQPGSSYFQGIALAGENIYTYEGAPEGDIYLYTFKLDGELLYANKVTGSANLSYREAEGIAVVNGKIYIGIASIDEHWILPDDKVANIFYFE